MVWEGGESRHMHKASLACKEEVKPRAIQGGRGKKGSMRKLAQSSYLGAWMLTFAPMSADGVGGI